MRVCETILTATEALRSEVLSLMPDDVVTESRALYTAYLHWLTPAWIFLDTQIESSPLHYELHVPETAGLRTALLSEDYSTVAYANSPGSSKQAPSIYNAFRTFSEIPSAAQAVGILVALLSLERDAKEIGKRLRKLGLKNHAGASFYSGSLRIRSKVRRKFYARIDEELSEDQISESADYAKKTLRALAIYFTSFREFADSIRETSAA